MKPPSEDSSEEYHWEFRNLEYLAEGRGFYHGNPVMSPSMVDLKNELQRLKSYTMETIDHTHLRRLEDVGSIILNLNIQSLSAHMLDLTSDNVLMKAHVFCLTETRVVNESPIEIEGLQLLVQNKRSGKTGGVAIYERVLSSSRSVSVFRPELSSQHEGDICAAEMCLYGRLTMIVCVYINPNTSFDGIRGFFARHQAMLVSDRSGAATPLLLCGDFSSS